MKILLFNTLYHPNIVGGAEKSVQLLAEQLLEHQFEPIVVSTAEQDKIDYVNGVKVYYLRNRNVYWGIKSKDKPMVKKVLWHSIDVYNKSMFKVINQIVNDEEPDVIHTNNLAGLSIVPWIAAKKKNIPVVHTLRDFSLMCLKSTMFKKGENCVTRCKECQLYTALKKKLSNENYVSYLVGNSNFMINFHKENHFFNETPSSRIFNGVNLQNETQISLQNIDTSKRLKFFYMGRIEETKGVNLILNAFLEIQNADLYLAGVVYDDVINEKIKDGYYTPNIHFMGYINPSEVLPEMDVLIAPSLWHEPLPRVILEAYSHNVPVIGTNRGGIPECIDDGKTGFIFDPYEKKQLDKIIDNVCRNPRKLKNLKINISKFIQQFDIKETVKQYINVYEKVNKKT